MTAEKPITIDQLSRLGVDDNNRLFWDGQPVVTEQSLTLRWWVSLSIVAGGFATVVLAVMDVLRYVRSA